MQTTSGTARQRAWKTRRLRYGPHGHAGTYARSRTEHGEILAGRAERRLARLVALCLADGTLLSEGQVARTLGLGRIDVRRLRDDGRESIAADPIPGEWGRHATGKVVAS